MQFRNSYTIPIHILKYLFKLCIDNCEIVWIVTLHTTFICISKSLMMNNLDHSRID
jgi:hypothetical protein